MGAVFWCSGSVIVGRVVKATVEAGLAGGAEGGNVHSGKSVLSTAGSSTGGRLVSGLLGKNLTAREGLRQRGSNNAGGIGEAQKGGQNSNNKDGKGGDGEIDNVSDSAVVCRCEVCLLPGTAGNPIDTRGVREQCKATMDRLKASD